MYTFGMKKFCRCCGYVLTIACVCMPTIHDTEQLPEHAVVKMLDTSTSASTSVDSRIITVNNAVTEECYVFIEQKEKWNYSGYSST